MQPKYLVAYRSLNDNRQHFIRGVSRDYALGFYRGLSDREDVTGVVLAQEVDIETLRSSMED